MPATDGIEVEWQFGVDDLAAAERALHACASALRLTLAPSTSRVLLDEYLDTTDWAFHRASFALRVRDADGAVEATLKGFGDQSDGPYVRREINEPLDRAGHEALLASAGPVARRVRAVVGAGELRGLFALRTERRTFDVSSNGASRPIAEVALDATEVETAGGSPHALRRIEIELADPAALAAVEEFAAALGTVEGFERASTSKFAIGLAATGRSPTGVPDLGPTGVDLDSTLGAVVYAALRRQFAAFLANEPGTRLGEDIEALHDMRVATRRLRTAVSVFSGALPPELLAVRPDFGWVADVLGEVRDLDVQLAWLREEAAASAGIEEASLTPLIELLDGQREEARERMLAALDSPRYASLVAVMTGMVRAGETTAVGSTPAARTMPDLLRRRWRRYNRVARALEADSTHDDFHSARLLAKRIRYATQCAAELYGEAARPFVAALRRVQEQLGRRQDAVVALALLERTAAEEPLPASTLSAMERLAEREHEVVRSAGETFPETHRGLRREWRLLRAAAEQAALDR